MLATLTVAALTIPCTALAATPVATIDEAPPDGSLPTIAGARLRAVFYADTSCLLVVDSHASIGHTLIDADVGEGGSRMLIHCDTDEGQRLTLLARSERLETSTRVALLSRADIESGESGIIAWLTRAGTTFADESEPRRYVTRGEVLVREVPPVQVAGAALHGERRPFAQVEGILETLLAHPGTGSNETR